jgi:hypothetical protein
VTAGIAAAALRPAGVTNAYAGKTPD